MADGHILKVLGCIEEAILIPPTESGAVALAKDAHATITALLAEIARLRALGLEACSLVDAERDDARRVQAETTTALVTADRELAKLRAELAELTVTRDRLLAREHEDGRLHAQLRAELAELRARTALTVEAFTEAYIKTKHGGKAWPGEEADRRGLTAQFRATFAALGPVALPSPDRAEELTAAIYGDSFSELRVADRLSMVRRTKDALAKLTPAPARPATAAKGG